MRTFHLLRSALVVFALGAVAPDDARAQAAGDATQTVYDVSAVDQPPELKKRIKPSYSSALRKRATPAEITLRFVVTTEGKVTEINVVRFTDSDMVDPVFAAYEEARYTPGVKNGKPVNTRMEVTELCPEPKAPKKK